MNTESLLLWKAKAEAATPGPYTTDYDRDACCIDVAGERIAVTNDRNWFSTGLREEQCQANAAFIVASNPQAVLALIDEVLASREKIKKLEERLGAFHVHGSDGCKNCETGRITLYARFNWCIDCLVKAKDPAALTRLK